MCVKEIGRIRLMEEKVMEELHRFLDKTLIEPELLKKRARSGSVPFKLASNSSANMVSMFSLAGSISKAGLMLKRIISTKPDAAAFTATFGL